MKYALTGLAALLSIAALTFTFAAIWTTGGYWPGRFAGSAFVCGFLAVPAVATAAFHWSES